MFFVYVLWSDKLKKRYVGFTSDLLKRLSQHNQGKSTFTKNGIPWLIIYSEEYKTETEARHREKFLKSGAGRKFLDSQLKNKDAGVSASG